MSEHVWRGGPAPMIVPALVDALVLRHAASRPEAVAVVDERAGRSATYGQLADGSARVAGGLAARGIGRGDVVAIVAPNGLEHVLALLGTLRAGAAVASANPMLSSGRAGLPTGAGAAGPRDRRGARDRCRARGAR